MAKVGDRLPQPEPGWKRYDDTHPAIKYEGKWHTSSFGSDKYNNTFKYTNDKNAKASFNFMGTSLRIITFFESHGSSDILITIDGKEYHYSQKGNRTPIALSFELTDLENKIHTVKIRTNINNQQLTIDAIDIDEDGILLHPDEVLDIKDLEVGKRIRCHYTATNNRVGVFSNLGKEVYVDGINDFIPSNSSATPNGCFYFICVDKDHLGRWKLIADRNIQHSISWDTLNNAGIASGSGINYSLNDQGAIIRLLTGGVSSTDKDNEWDRYIVNSTLNGTIEAGDDNVWNYSPLKSWTRVMTDTDEVVVRGSGWSIANPATTNADIGFRPVLLVSRESLFLIYKDGKYYYYDVVSGSLELVGTFLSGREWQEYGMRADVLKEIPEEVWGSLESIEIVELNGEKGSTLIVEDYTDQAIKFLGDTFKILAKTEEVGTSRVRLSAVPHPRIIFPTGDIRLDNVDEILNITLTTLEQGEGVVKVIASVDKGETWKYFSNGNWHILNPDSMEEVKELGMTPSLISSLGVEEWSALRGKSRTLRFAYYLEVNSLGDRAETDELVSTVNMRGKWRGAVHGRDYEYEYQNYQLTVELFADGSYKINY